MIEDTHDAPAGNDAPAAEPSRRDEIASAFEKLESESPPAPAAPPAGSPGEPPAPAAPAAPGDRTRGADGRFRPGGPEAPAKAIQKPQGAPVAPGDAPGGKQPLVAPGKPQDAPKGQPEAPAPVQVKAPASWKPGAREHWARLPPEVQQEVVRRESEVARVMKESAGARDALGHVQKALAPYAQNIAASGSDAIGAIQNFFQADNTLRHGSQADKAATVASIIKSYGVDIAALDATLAGQVLPADPNSQMADRLRREMQQQLQPVLGFFNQIQGQRQQAVEQINTNAATEVETFGQDAAHEFFEDVREDMADIIDLYTQRGVAISLHDAYERAIKLNPQVSGIIAQRADQERANAAAAAAQRARRTAASIGGSSAPAGAGPGPVVDDRRAVIEAAWDAAQG